VTRVVAAFDFDGTLTRRDTLAPFLVRSRGYSAVARSGIRHLPSLASAAAGRGSRDTAKAALLRSVYAGVDADEMRAIGTAYASEVTARALRSDTVARLDWHRNQGHELVLITASLSLYAFPVADRLGIPTVFATTLSEAHGRLTGELDGLNMRGPEKARRLAEHLGGEAATVWAYGDSAGDRELLAAATYATIVKGVQLAPAPELADR
jgi:phosphatidylglycerophosphatase C